MKRIILKISKGIGYFLLVVLLLVVGLLLFIRTPYGQNFIVGKALAYLRQQTESRWELDRLFITFQGDLALEGLLVGDSQGDTLLYIGKLETGFALWPFLRSGTLGISGVELEQVRAHIVRDEEENFNFDFILEALLGEEEAPAPKPGELGSPAGSEAPEETADLGTLYLGPVQLKDIQLAFRDESLGIDLEAEWKEFRMKTEKLDLDAGAYLLESIDWEGLQVRYEQFHAFPASEEETAPSEGPLPVISLGKLRMPNARLQYSDLPGALAADLGWDEFIFELPELDLQEQNVHIHVLRFSGLRAALELDSSVEMPTGTAAGDTEGAAPPADTAETVEEIFSWPDWRVNFADLSLEDAAFRFTDRAGTAEVLPFIDPNDVQLADFNLALRQITLKPGRLKAHLHTFTLKEQRGLQLEELSLALALEEEGLEIADFRFQLPGTSLRAESELRFPSIASLLGENPLEALNYGLQLEARTDFQQLAFFVPELVEEPWFKALKPFKGSFTLNGDAENLQLSRLEMDLSETLSLRVPDLYVAHFMDPEKLRVELPELRFTGYGRGLGALADWQGGPLPERFTLQLSSQGGSSGLRSQLALRSPIGDINWQLEGGQRAPASYFMTTDLRIRDLNLSDLLELPELAPISTRLQAEGSFSSLEDLQARLRWDFDQLAYDSLDLSALRMELALEEGEGDLTLRHARDWFDLDLRAAISLDSLAQEIALQLNIPRFDAQHLGLSDTPLEGQLGLRLGARYAEETLDFGLKLEQAAVLQAGRRFELGDFNLTGLYQSDFIKLNVRSDFLNGATVLEGDPNYMAERLEIQLRSHLGLALPETYTAYLQEADSTDTYTLSGAFSFYPNELIQNFLEENFTLDTLRLSFQADAQDQNFALEARLPEVGFGDVTVDGFRFKVAGDSAGLTLETGISGLNGGAFKVGETLFGLTAKAGDFRQSLEVFQEQEKFMAIRSELYLRPDSLAFRLDGEELLLNQRSWQMDPENVLWYADGRFGAEKFRLTRNQQSLQLTGTVLGAAEDAMTLSFEQFRLGTFTNFLNPDEPLASGTLDGFITVERPLENPGLLAAFRIDQLEAMQLALGNFSLDAEATTLESYTLALALKEGLADVEFGGTFHADAQNSFEFDLDLQRFDLAQLPFFTDSLILEAGGRLQGKMRLYGTAEDPQYAGSFALVDDAFLVPADLNAPFRFSADPIRVEREGIKIERFRVYDENNATFTLKGEVDTRDFDAIRLDLEMDSRDFTLFDLKRGEQELFFGRAKLDLDLAVKGPLDNPDIRTRVKLLRGTEVTVFLPEDQVDVVERSGVVLLVDRENEENLDAQRQQELLGGALTGLAVEALIEIDPTVVFNVIVDERSGDNLRLQGKADLQFNLSPNGRMNLAGIYEVRSGHYELSLFGLVNRRFELGEGSRVSWRGDPLDAELDLKTIYSVRTPVTELMLSQLSGVDPESAAQYRQSVPFQVFLFVRGDLLQPAISFGLDMAEQDRGALGGSVYGAVLALNEREDELNRQVFSLLVLNQFFPGGNNDGASGGSVNIARNSVSNLLSNQLNALSDKLFGESGFSLDLGLDSFQDFEGGTGQDRTQLNVAARQRLFDDRLVISIGGQVAVEGGPAAGQQQNALFGDVEVEYLLTPAGMWRAKAFRKNQFESIVDGQLIITGGSLIFNREFNYFKELWRPRKSEEEDPPMSPEEQLREVKEAEKKENEKP